MSGKIKGMKLEKYDCVCKVSYELDKYHAAYERITAKSAGKAKSKYKKLYPDTEFTKILVRKSKIHSFE
jgi:hypothetical protein